MKNVTAKSLFSAIVQVSGVAAGVMAGGAINNVIPVGDPTTRKALSGAAGLVGSLTISEKGDLNKFLKNMATGVAVKGAHDLVVSKVKNTIEITDSESLLGKLQSGALGLNAPTLQEALAAPGRCYINPTIDWEENPAKTAGSDPDVIDIA